MDELTLDVPVHDVPAAVRFYCAALEGVTQGAGSSEICEVNLGCARLRVLDEAAHVPTESDRRHYVKGRVPRLEFRVHDVARRVQQSLAAGATLRSQSPGADDQHGSIRYAQIIDPFGHLWSFAEASERDGAEPAP